MIRRFLTWAAIAIVGFSASAFAVDISSLPTDRGFRFLGQLANGRLGARVNGICDINGDEIDDAFVYTFGSSGYIIFGRSQGFPYTITPQQIAASFGVTVSGVSGNHGGISAVGCFDANDDGLTDLLVADPSHASQLGRVFLLYGSSTLPSTIDLSTLDGNNGVIFNGYTGSGFAGGTLGSGGDFNDDGIDDFAIGVPGNNRSYIVFGRSFPFVSPMSLANITQSNGVEFQAGATGLVAGRFNADGFSDFMAVGNSFDGKSYLRHGPATGGSPASIIRNATSSARNVGDVNGDGRDEIGFAFDSGCSLLLGTEVAGILDINAGDPAYFMSMGSCGGGVPSVSGAGDFNGDGLSDLLLVRSPADAAVWFGRAGFSATGSAANADPTFAEVLALSSPYDGLGYASASGVGDINNDGLDDVALGFPESSIDAQKSGAVVFVFGRGERIFSSSFE